MTHTTDAVDLFKKALDHVDEGPFVAWLRAREPIDPVLRATLADFIRGERTRLVKLRSLGLTVGTDARLSLIERVLGELQEN